MSNILTIEEKTELRNFIAYHLGDDLEVKPQSLEMMRSIINKLSDFVLVNMTSAGSDDGNEIREEINVLQSTIRPMQNRIKELEDKLKVIRVNEENRIFEENKEQVAAFKDAGANYVFAEPNEKPDYREASEDDGTLHITIGQVRGCFISNQDISRSEWKRQALPILAQFGFKAKELKY